MRFVPLVVVLSTMVASDSALWRHVFGFQLSGQGVTRLSSQGGEMVLLRLLPAMFAVEGCCDLDFGKEGRCNHAVPAIGCRSKAGRSRFGFSFFLPPPRWGFIVSLLRTAILSVVSTSFA